MPTDQDNAIARFPKDVADHRMTIVQDDGVLLCLRFAKPGTGVMSFTLTTWPWHLSISGDMGCFVFSRIEYMADFFDANHIDLGYWAEKLQASDKSDGHERFSADASIECLLSNLDELHEGEAQQLRDASEGHDDPADWARSVKDALEDTVEYEDVVPWDYVLTVHTFRYVWCCHAIAWGLQQYRAAKAAASAPTSAIA